MLHEMMQYTIRRTDAGRFVTIRDISKRFSVPTQEVISLLTGEVYGYELEFNDSEVKGTTVVTVKNVFVDEDGEDLGSPVDMNYVPGATLTEEETAKVEDLMDAVVLPENYVEKVVETETAEETGTFSPEEEAFLMVTLEPSVVPTAEQAAELDRLMDSVLNPDKAEADPYAGIEAEIEAHIMPVKASRKVDASYTRYTTLEEAEAALGYRLISVAELHKACDRWGVKVNRMVKALGGDRGLGEPRSAEWKPVLVGRSRHVAMSCVEDLKNL